MKTIRKNLLLLAFAAGALFLIGNNVMADDPTEIFIGSADEVSITCTQEAGPGAQCWRKDWRGRCVIWTGYVNDRC